MREDDIMFPHPKHLSTYPQTNENKEESEEVNLECNLFIPSHTSPSHIRQESQEQVFSFFFCGSHNLYELRGTKYKISDQTTDITSSKVLLQNDYLESKYKLQEERKKLEQQIHVYITVFFNTFENIKTNFFYKVHNTINCQKKVKYEIAI
ncbi:hypothetical protein RFI_07307 [Reticulomyxa filosa]|uniref:Uncharacterized protein n=1 Tax=Reticulomyxa filosa TaxID=46433 RepID=X6NWZ1_RETFI|nr:hypothetical protein RFI_07307 [Reticulomyxa filosa]|eukprot:ETO29812.1 hypothetical protein RFI_07307 [Reticulomyxa filosa]